MTTPKHTPEPWAYNENTHRVWANTHESEKYNHNDAIICELSHYTVADREAAANAARIVECVNAMAGIEKPIQWVKDQNQFREEFSNSSLSAEVDKRIKQEKLHEFQVNQLVQQLNDITAQRDFNFQQWQEISELAANFKRQRDTITKELTMLLSRIESAKPDERGCYEFPVCKPYIADMRSKITWLQRGEQAPEHSDELPH